MILAGDIGGTKTILALYDISSGQAVCHKKMHFASRAHGDFTGLLNAFLNADEIDRIDSACLGVAGPIVDGDCVTTNLPWVLRRSSIGDCIGTHRIRLLNDLEATAWGVMDLPGHDFAALNPDGNPQPGNCAVLAAGTGLGEAIIAWDGHAHHVLASEGGHCDFAPGSEQEIELLRYLWPQYQGHVSYERLLSGEGLANIYRFLKETGHAPEQPAIEHAMHERDPAAVIGEAGVAGTDALCVAALTLFCRIYGAEAGNLALKCLPYSGVFLAGGIAAKILPFLLRSAFMDGYLAKGRYSSALQKIPVKVCTHLEVGLLGALACGVRGQAA